jgi:hypothetical protein
MDLRTLATGAVLTDVCVNALRSWGIFDRQRKWARSKSQFLNRLLDCYECTSVWAGTLVVGYLLWFEWEPLTYLLLFHRLAMFLHTAYEWLDAARAVKEGEI